MPSLLAYYAKLALAGLFGLVIPWWLWGALAFAVAITVFLVLPVAIPERLRLLLAGVVLVVGFTISAGSWGIEYGTEVERQGWELKVAKEKARLELGFKQQAAKDAERVIDAEAHSGRLKGELADVLAAADQQGGQEAQDLLGGRRGGGENPRQAHGQGQVAGAQGYCPSDCIVLGAPLVDRVRGWTTRRPPYSRDANGNPQ